MNSPLIIIALQILLSLCTALMFGYFSQAPKFAIYSALLGGMAAWLPATIFALKWRFSFHHSPLLTLFNAELLKIITTLALFLMIVFYGSNILWLPLLSAFIIALKVYWIALFIR